MADSRNQGLDVLRGIAVLLVIGCHLQYYVWWHRIGWAGVDLFFVLSGFLISGLLFNEFTHSGRLDIRRFWIRRIFKIWPALYVFLTVIAVLFHPSIGSVATAALFVKNYFLSPMVFLEHTWSLGVEEHFYLLLPLLLLVLSRRQGPDPFRSIPMIFLGVFVVCLSLRCWFRPHEAYATHYRMDALFAGAMIGYLRHFRRDYFNRLTGPYGLFIGLVCVSIIAIYRWENPQMQTWGLSVVLIGFTCVVAWVSVREIPRVLRPLASIGFYSYSIYLWQQPATFGVTFIAPHSLVAFWISVTTAITVGVLASVLIEIPMLRLRDRLFPSVSSVSARRVLPDSGAVPRTEPSLG